MSTFPSDVAFTPAVKAIQEAKGSRHAYANVELGDGWQTTIEPELAEFIARLDMFYLGTANASGQPYIQYRGGSPGFLKVLDEKTVAFADFRREQAVHHAGQFAGESQGVHLLDGLHHQHADQAVGHGESGGRR